MPNPKFNFLRKNKQINKVRVRFKYLYTGYSHLSAAENSVALSQDGRPTLLGLSNPEAPYA